MKNHVKLRKLNPYPVDVFTEPRGDEVKRATQLMIDNGISPERVYGDFGRNIWNHACDRLREIETGC